LITARARVYLHAHRCSVRHTVTLTHRLHSNTGRAGCPQRRRSPAARKTHPRAKCEGWLYRGRPWRTERRPPAAGPHCRGDRSTTAHVVCTTEETTATTTTLPLIARASHFLFRRGCVGYFVFLLVFVRVYVFYYFFRSPRRRPSPLPPRRSRCAHTRAPIPPLSRTHRSAPARSP